jgi:hypothetical protein
MFSLEKDENLAQRGAVIDASFMGNMARYINHSCNVRYVLVRPTAGRRGIKGTRGSKEALLSIPSGSSRPTRNLPTTTSSRRIALTGWSASARLPTASCGSTDLIRYLYFNHYQQCQNGKARKANILRSIVYILSGSF